MIWYIIQVLHAGRTTGKVKIIRSYQLVVFTISAHLGSSPVELSSWFSWIRCSVWMKRGRVPIRIRKMLTEMIGFMLWSIDDCTTIGATKIPIVDIASISPTMVIWYLSENESTLSLVKKLPAQAKSSHHYPAKFSKQKWPQFRPLHSNSKRERERAWRVVHTAKRKRSVLAFVVVL